MNYQTLKDKMATLQVLSEHIEDLASAQDAVHTYTSEVLVGEIHSVQVDADLALRALREQEAREQQKFDAIAAELGIESDQEQEP